MANSRMKFRATLFSAAWVTCLAAQALAARHVLPNGQSVTPTAAAGSRFMSLNPHLESDPNFVAGQAITTAVSPDGKTLLVLTSGFNRMYDASGKTIPEQSNEYVFVYDISSGAPLSKQVLPVPNTFAGLTFAPDGNTFFVSGGVNDDVHVFTRTSGSWVESGSAIALGHGSSGNGLFQGVLNSVAPEAAGLALTSDGKKMVVANYENDSISIVDVSSRKKIGELDLRPGKIDPVQAGIAGGEFPFWVVVQGNHTAFVSSVRDREIIAVDLQNAPKVMARIQVQGNPNKMLLDKAQARLFVACDNSDTVDVIDTNTKRVVRRIKTTAPRGTFPYPMPPGSSPNSLALSPDERTLYVTNAGTNSVAVIALEADGGGQVEGLIPTGWYPNSVSVSADGRMLYVANGKSNAGPNPGNCAGTSPNNGYAPGCPSSRQNGSANQYVWQLTKAGLLTLPVPHRADLGHLTSVVAQNNGFTHASDEHDHEVMSALRERIKHVIYIVKENRTYDQILGDIKNSNGDPSITQFPEPITPNFHALAKRFVNLDNFYCSGEVSMDGWQWSVAARTSDLNDKTTPINYAGRGLSYDSEGTSRDFNLAFANSEERRTYNPNNPADPDLLPGPRNEVELDSSAGEEGGGYIWNAALRGGKSVRNYGFWIDLSLYGVADALHPIPPLRDARAAGVKVAVPASADLLPLTDPYFRGFDDQVPDFYRFKEWEREFDSYVKSGSLPNFEMVRFMNDHTGAFSTALDGVNTPEMQQADNDYAVGLLVDKVAHSRFAGSTLIFVLEDDSQDGPDHVDSHRSTAYIAGPYVKQSAVVSTRYATVNMLRTIEDILGIQHMNLHDGGVPPMTDVFDLNHRVWNYAASPSDILRLTTLPLPAKPKNAVTRLLKPRHDAAWWAVETAGFDFSKADRIDAQAFNRILWKGLMGDKPYPIPRSRAD